VVHKQHHGLSPVYLSWLSVFLHGITEEESKVIRQISWIRGEIREESGGPMVKRIEQSVSTVSTVNQKRAASHYNSKSIKQKSIYQGLEETTPAQNILLQLQAKQ
jgi:hypothetical protein